MEKPLIIQNDGTIMLDVHTPDSDLVRSHLSSFAELVASPEHIHTYRITNLSLWNAASFGISYDHIENILESYKRYPIPKSVISRIKDAMLSWGKLCLLPTDREFVYKLVASDNETFDELSERRDLKEFLHDPDMANNCFFIDALVRGTLKQALLKIGFPVIDKIPLKPGEPLKLELATETTAKPFKLRPYQVDAVKIFVGAHEAGQGYGVIVLPCGAGKTVVGLGAMNALQYETLILSPNVSAARQWKREILQKTSLTDEEVGEYSGERKEIRPVTIATYQILTYRNEKDNSFPHWEIFTKRNWGLIIYDEVHLLPAPVFRITAEIQSKHRLGLTATLVREDELQGDVFSLVGPKRFEISWKDMENLGFIAKASCTEFRVNMPKDTRSLYLNAKGREQARIASENPNKISCVIDLVKKHHPAHTLVIGQFIDQLEETAKALNAPLITGSMPNQKREELYAQFRSGEIKLLVVSKVANFAIDLPDASVAIQISGTFGSRQEEAQRLGRIMRPKDGPALFYTLVSRGTVEEEYSLNRQRFLGEQGYTYHLENWEL